MGKIIGFHEEKSGNGTLVLHKVDDPRRYGIVKLGDDDEILATIEKPTMEEAKPYKRDDHWLNIAGLMIVSPKIFDYIENLEPGKDDEIWLTDAVEEMRKDENDIYGYIFEGKRYDIGTFESLRKADELAMDDNFYE